MQIIEFIVEVLLLGPWFWVGAAVGLGGAWIAWTYLPQSVNRAAGAAVIFVAGCVLGIVLEAFREKRK